MYGGQGELLYVGKARNLRKRVGSYFMRASGDARIESMVSQIRRIEVTVTHTEDEALILEATLIKELQPRYNILYRDDKSYPYVRFSSHRYPRISYYRGEKRGDDQYFGPFPSATAVRETLYTLQKLFRLRPCRDSFFAHRDRACLQYQIKRCSGPCVGLISPEDYAQDLRNARRLLEGKGDELAAELAQEMELAAEALAFGCPPRPEAIEAAFGSATADHDEAARARLCDREIDVSGFRCHFFEKRPGDMGISCANLLTNRHFLYPKYDPQ